MSILGKILLILIGKKGIKKLDRFRAKYRLTSDGILSILMKANDEYPRPEGQSITPILKDLIVNLFIKNVKCPSCGWRGKSFLPIYREYDTMYNAFCPRCGSHSRHRLQYFYLKKILPNTQKIKLLHFSPEKCLERTIKEYPNIEYISADISKKRAIHKQDIRNLRYKENYFDIVICNHVLEHVKEDRQALKEIYRVLKAKGFAIIMIPQSNKKKTFEDDKILTHDYAKYYEQSDHVRIYGQDFIAKPIEIGFKVDIYDCRKKYNKKEIMEYGLFDGDRIFTCYKN